MRETRQGIDLISQGSGNARDNAPRIQHRRQDSRRDVERIYIHGIGNIGMLVAHSLRGIPDPPPITLLFYRKQQQDDFKKAKGQIALRTGDHLEERKGYELETVNVPHREYGRYMPLTDAQNIRQARAAGVSAESLTRQAQVAESRYFGQLRQEQDQDSRIKHLILSVKATGIVGALLSIKHRLGSESVVLFMNNGLGFIDEVNEKVFPDPKSRPQYMVGIITHGVNHDPSKPFEAVHAGFGTISLGLAPKFVSPSKSRAKETHIGPVENPNTDLDMYPSSLFLLRSLLRTPVLSAVAFSPLELLKLQLDKLAVNAVINPLTALFDCRNGALLHNFAITRVMRLLLLEVSSILTRLPELEGQPNIAARYSRAQLEAQVFRVAEQTKNNVSSMLQDSRAGKRTEIEYLNGWLVKKGEDIGVTAAFNFMIMQMVNGKHQIGLSERKSGIVPSKLA